MIATIFLGPTMSVDAARDIFPEGIYLPPAAQGDLLAAADHYHADIIGLIDGTFHQNLSVWHNEVCYLLSRGVTIYGSSSMGALRAVETELYGIRGVGAIYRWYRDGIISGDDEVALVHGDESSGFRPLSIPMVNVRASFAAAVAARMVDEHTARQAAQAAKAINYPERQVASILEACTFLGFEESQLVAVRKALTEGYADQKKEDAKELLRVIRDVVAGVVERPATTNFVFARSSVFETLYNLDREVQIDDQTISQQRIAEYTALYCPEFNKLRRSSLDRSLVSFFAALLDVRVTQENVEAERSAFCKENHLTSPEQLANWLSQNAISEHDFFEYLTQEACCHRLRFWALNSRSFDRGCKALLDELRRHGMFPRLAREAAEAESLFAVYKDQSEYAGLAMEHPGALAERHAEEGHACITGDARLWAEEAGFDGVPGLGDALRRATVVNDVRRRIARQMEALDQAIAAFSSVLTDTAVN